MGIGSRLRLFWTAGRGVTTGMTEADEAADPIDLFGDWFAAASEAGLYLPEAMSLSTSSTDGKPSSRMVLLKAFGQDGFVFYTNYTSRKAAELDDNPYAALLFHWPILQRQIRIEGSVHRASAQTSDAYFETRDRGSQIGAWASRQSSRLKSRAELEQKVDAIQRQFDGQDVPRPEFWGGYRLEPISMEFWQGRVNRLHDRIRFVRESNGWQGERLYP